jgi:hypothetical protein
MEVSAGCGDAAAHVAPLLRRVYVFHDGENAYIPPTVNNGGGLFNDVVVRVRNRTLIECPAITSPQTPFCCAGDRAEGGGL